MLTQDNRKDIRECISKGTKPTLAWLDSLEDSVMDLPLENYSGELIDKRPETKKKSVVDQLDFVDDIFEETVVSIDVGGNSHKTKWQKFKATIKGLFGIKDKSYDEDIEDYIMDNYSPFAGMDAHMKESLEKEETHTPKELLSKWETLKQALQFAEIMYPEDSSWDHVRERTRELRKLFSKNPSISRNVSIDSQSGVAIAVEVEKEGEIRPDDLRRAIRLYKSQRA
jgi:hypothetical protein